MYKIIGGDGQEYGPVDIEQLRQWIAEGRLDGRTMVQLEGATDWQPAMAVTELAALLSSAGATSPPPATETPLPTTESILARDYQVQTGSWISAGWELVKSRFWMLVGATLVILLIQIAAESVPLIGGLVGLVITGPLYGGLYWLNLRLVRGEPAEFSDAFAGFNRAFVQLMLVNIIISLIIMAILVPGAVGVLGGLALMGVFGELADIVPNLSLPPLLTPLGYVFFAIGCLMAVAGVLATIYLTVCWWFGIPLVVDRQMDFWAAMKLSRAQIHKHWWGMFGFGFICCLVFGLGILLCGIGILVTIPIVVAASMYAYEDLFGRSSATSS